MVHDVDQDRFDQDVIERSREVPVIVDFWAEWCGPCRQLSPALEAEAGKRDGDVDLVKIDVDDNQALAGRFGVQGIPAVKAFVDGEVAAEFTGAIPPAQVAAFYDQLVPSQSDRLVAAGDEVSLRRALELDPKHADAAVRLAAILIARGEDGEAKGLVEPLEHDFRAAGLLARIELTEGEPVDERIAAGLAAWDGGDREAALEALQEGVAGSEDPAHVDRLRRVMVAIFTELGPESDLARQHRRRLALALS